jgi:hypothetical protein
MNSNGFSEKIAKLFFCLSILFIVSSCGSFQGASYFASDGIYVSNQENTQKENDYYSQYFGDVAEGYVDETSQETYFTDSENYTSLDKNQPTIVDENISQIPWGQQTNETEIIIVNNSPNYLWGLSNFAFRFSPFWNSYYSDPFRFGYGYNFNPFFNPYMNSYYRYNSYAGYWGGENPFFDPYNRYAGFYSPFRYGNYWGNNPWNRSNNSINIKGYEDNQYDSTVARIKSGRGEKNYADSTLEKDDKQSSQSNSVDIQKTIDLVNLGRGVNSLGRNMIIGTSIARNNINGAKSFGKSKTARPNTNTNGISRSNNNSSNSIKNSNSGRFSQSRFNLKEKNKSNTTSPKSTTRNLNSNRSRRTYTPSSINNKSNNTSRSYNTRSNNNTQTRSYNSSSSKSSYSSSGPSSSRSSSSGSKFSGGGRRNQ